MARLQRVADANGASLASIFRVATRALLGMGRADREHGSAEMTMTHERRRSQCTLTKSPKADGKTPLSRLLICTRRIYQKRGRPV